MRGRSVLIFLGGMLAGAALLYTLLYSGGVLSPYLEGVRTTTVPPPGVEPAPPEVDQPFPATGESDRMTSLNPMPPPPVGPTAPRQPDIVLPIEGLKMEDILDTFDQGRSGGRAHEAIDIMAPRGTPVRAMVDGEIKKLFNSDRGGLTIYQFDSKEELCYYYAHLDRYADGITEGTQVARGTVIGFVGSTGNADTAAPHLHLALFKLGPEKRWWEGTPVNPYPVLKDALLFIDALR
jgi:peptidoglycan LD-endopeptidase LytH